MGSEMCIRDRANSAPPLSVTDSAIAPSARILTKAVKSKIASPLQHHTTFFVERGIYSFTAPEALLLLQRIIVEEKLDAQMDALYILSGLRSVFHVFLFGGLNIVGSSSQADCLKRNTAMDDSIGGS